MIGIPAYFTNQEETNTKVDVYRQKFIELIAGYIPIIIYVYNYPSYVTDFTTREISNVLGYTQEEAILGGKGFTKSLFHPEDVGFVYEMTNKTAKLPDGEVSKFRYRMVSKNGEIIWFNTEELVFDRDENGNATKILGFAQDVTQNIKFIESLQNKNERLAEIAHINSHHVRGPVATILGLTTLFDPKIASSEINLKVINSLKLTADKLDKVIKEIMKQAESLDEIEDLSKN